MIQRFLRFNFSHWTPLAIRRLVLTYLVVGCGLTCWIATRILQSSLEVHATQVKPQSVAVNESTQHQLPEVPEMKAPEFLLKRLRHREMPPPLETQPQKPKTPEPAPRPPIQFQGEVIATYVETPPQTSFAAIRISNSVKLLKIGEVLEVSNQRFTLDSVSRTEVSFSVAGEKIVVPMKTMEQR